MEIYKERSLKFDEEYRAYKRKYKIVGILRLLVFLALVVFFYMSLRKENFNYLYGVLGSLVVFLLLLRRHVQMAWQLNYLKTLFDINQEELCFLESGTKPFADGKEFLTTNHPYALDLDIFGEGSLFQYLNRTASFLGKYKLATLISTIGEASAIVKNQDAVKELQDRVEWRQRIHALSRMASVDQTTSERLQSWATQELTVLSKLTVVLSFLIPILFVLCAALYVVHPDYIWGKLAGLFFTLNLILFSMQLKAIQSEINVGDKMHEPISNYALVVKELNRISFQSSKLKSLLGAIENADFKAEREFKILSKHLEKLHTIGNIFVAIAFNGVGQYHVHQLRRYIQWKKHNAPQVLKVVETIGEIEALNSLANFAYNNPGYAFPSLSLGRSLSFAGLGHPMIRETNRVTNDITFDAQRFVILTGSNMSGKSTFLRTLGVNMVLAGMGAPVCASQASIYPMPLWVSMRLSDSLEDNASYFFAEVQRLQSIIESANQQPCFVLLDEILRGTNSEDKKTGTVGVIRKFIKHPTFGVIATHDLEVCKVEEGNEEVVTNKCFEVEIKDEELYFDYRLREGICKSKNATFIMKKMGIID